MIYTNKIEEKNRKVAKHNFCIGIVPPHKQFSLENTFC